MLKNTKTTHSEETILEDADHLFELMAQGKGEVMVQVEKEPFHKSAVLKLTSLCTTSPGGGYYQLFNHRGKLILSRLWLCDMPLVLFGDIPEKIFVKIRN